MENSMNWVNSWLLDYSAPISSLVHEYEEVIKQVGSLKWLVKFTWSLELELPSKFCLVLFFSF